MAATATIPPPIVPRTLSDGSLKMQVMIQREVDGVVGNYWHRQMPDLLETACEIKKPSGQFLPTRRESLLPEDGAVLCPICFTPGERERSRRLNREHQDRHQLELEEWAAEARARRDSNDKIRSK